MISGRRVISDPENQELKNLESGMYLVCSRVSGVACVLGLRKEEGKAFGQGGVVARCRILQPGPCDDIGFVPREWGGTGGF